MNQHKIYLISGVSGVGKTSALEHLKKILPQSAFDVRDFDERGVPDGGGPKWHDNETRHWLDVAISNAKIGKSTIIYSFTNPEQFKKIHKTESDVKAVASLAEGNTSNLVDQGKGLYRISNSLSLTIQSAKEAVR